MTNIDDVPAQRGRGHVIGEAVFSIWAGAIVAGRDGLYRVDSNLGEFRQIPPLMQLPQQSQVFFSRGITHRSIPGRFLGALRIASDRVGRKGYHGFGVAVGGRDPRALEESLPHLNAWLSEEEDAYAQLSTASGVFADQPESAPSQLRLMSSGNIGAFSLDANATPADIWQQLWSLSWSNGNFLDIIASTALDGMPEYEYLHEVAPAVPTPAPVGNRPAIVRGGEARESAPPNSAKQSNPPEPQAVEGIHPTEDLVDAIEQLSDEVEILKERITTLEHRQQARHEGQDPTHRAAVPDFNPRLFQEIEGRSWVRLLLWGAGILAAILVAVVATWLIFFSGSKAPEPGTVDDPATRTAPAQDEPPSSDPRP